jgi:putative Holliday junction resolvase
MRILAIDPGEKFIGLAISDPTGTIAGPLTVLRHRSREADAAAIARLAAAHGVARLVVGQATDAAGAPTTLQARRAANLAATLRTLSGLPVVLWDETGSTQKALQAWQMMGAARRRQRRPDAVAATVILQSYLDAGAPLANEP